MGAWAVAAIADQLTVEEKVAWAENVFENCQKKDGDEAGIFMDNYYLIPNSNTHGCVLTALNMLNIDPELFAISEDKSPLKTVKNMYMTEEGWFKYNLTNTYSTNFNKDMIIGLGDLVSGTNVWVNMYLDNQKLNDLINASEKLLGKGTEEQNATLQKAYDAAVAVKDKESGFATEYFNLQTASKAIGGSEIAPTCRMCSKENGQTIDQLVSDIDKIGTVTLDKAETIEALKKTYDELPTDIAKSYVTNADVLTTAVDTIKQLKEEKIKEEKANFKAITVALSSANASSSSEIKVTWEKVSEAEGYYVYRKNGSSWKKIATIKNNDTLSYTDSNLNAETSYTYTVCAYKTIAEEVVSSTYNKTGVSAVTKKDASKEKFKATTVTLSSAKANGTSKIKISWKKVSGAEGYYVYRKNGSSWKQIATIKGNTLSYTDSKLKVATSYTYTVRAYKTIAKETVLSSYNKTGKSAVTDFSKTTLSSVKSASYNSIKISWKKVTNASGYYVYRKDGSSWKKIATVKKGSTVSYTAKGLKTGTKYTYTVRAYKTVNGKAITGAYNTTGKSAKPVLEAVKLGKVSKSGKALKVTWQKTSGASGYYVYRKNGSSWKKIATVKKASTVSFKDNNVKKNTKYTYKVCAYRNVDGKAIKGTSTNKSISGKIK